MKVDVEPASGFQAFHGRKLAYGVNLSSTQIRPATSLMTSLYKLFQAKDCSLAEINPLVATADGELLALDAKLNFDDNALFRHSDIEQLHDLEQVDPLEARANELGVKNYIKMDGNIGCMVNGAGLAMAVMDLITKAGGKPANFLDIGGSSSPDKVLNAMRILLSDERVKAVLFNIFGGITRCDDVAKGMVQALNEIGTSLPIVVRLTGTNEEEGRRILRDVGLEVGSSMDEAVQKAVSLAG